VEQTKGLNERRSFLPCLAPPITLTAAWRGCTKEGTDEKTGVHTLGYMGFTSELSLNLKMGLLGLAAATTDGGSLHVVVLVEWSAICIYLSIHQLVVTSLCSVSFFFQCLVAVCVACSFW
jgi:hypothetical protein